MLVDAIIAGVREKRVQERVLERGESLTLNKAIELTQQFEISQKQMKIVRDEDSQISAVTVKPKHFTPSKKMPFKGNSNYRKQASINSPKSCIKCGKHQQHKWNQGKCPAKGSVCSYCHKPNHWATVCNKRAVSTVTVDPKHEPSDDEEILSINTIQPSDPKSDKWVVELEIVMKLLDIYYSELTQAQSAIH